MTNSYGSILELKLSGQSHGLSIGMTLTGFPADIPIDQELLQAFLARRAPGKNAWATGRREPDIPVFQSGLQNGRTTGEAITAVIENRDVRKSDYDTDVPRPGHADFAAYCKYGASGIQPGGGRYSGRMTAPLCIAGGLCLQYLQSRGITIAAHAAAIAGIQDDRFDPMLPQVRDLQKKAFPVLNDAAGEKMQEAILLAKSRHDSVGGVIECAAVGVPAGIGEHPFWGMENRIAAIAFAIPGVKGIDFGSGFLSTVMSGAENNDGYCMQDGEVHALTNNHGGILGGMTTGMPVIFRVAVKPTPSIGLPQHSVRLSAREDTELKIKGRHDPCIVPRAVPVVEAVAAIAICEAMLWQEESP